MRLTGKELVDFVQNHMYTLDADGNRVPIDPKQIKDTSVDVHLCAQLKCELNPWDSMPWYLRWVRYIPGFKNCLKAVLPAIYPYKTDCHAHRHYLHELPYKEIDLTQGDYLLQPKAFVLGGLVEFVDMPKDISGTFLTVSTVARCGHEHSIAIDLKPNWRGRLTLELSSALQYYPIVLSNRMIIGTLIFERHQPTEGYRGRFQDQQAVQAFVKEVKPDKKV